MIKSNMTISLTDNLSQNLVLIPMINIICLIIMMWVNKVVKTYSFNYHNILLLIWIGTSDFCVYSFSIKPVYFCFYDIIRSIYLFYLVCGKTKQSL